jgi:STE24 endopeptidase
VSSLLPNLYAWVVFVALLCQYLASMLADALNRRAMRPELPAECGDVYDAETYARSQDYNRTRLRFGQWPRGVELALLLSFWFGGGFEWLDRALRSLGLGPIATGLLFFGALSLGQGLISLPFRLYSTFVIEERFGFNRTSVATFFGDLLKSLLLGVGLGAPFGALLLFVFQRAGAWAWLVCWGATATFILLLQFVAPRWLMPLFIKFTPLEEGGLRQRIMEYAGSVAFPVQNLFVVDGSRRSSKANAFFTGFGVNRRIGLFDTLIARHSTDEIVAIVAHEVGHYKKRHVIQGMFWSIAQLGLVFFLFGQFMQQHALFEAFGMSAPSDYAGLFLCTLLYEPLGLLFALFSLARSRRHEYEADAFAAQTTGDAEALVSGLKKLSTDSLSNLTPHPFYVRLHYTHPPLLARVAALRARGASGVRAASG